MTRMQSALDRLSPEARRRLRKQDSPAFSEPMLAILTKSRFNDPAWIFERKFDGERCLAIRKTGSVSLYSRNRKSLETQYPEIAQALAGEGPNLTLDGEVVAFEHGVTSFPRLQGRMQLRNHRQIRESGIAVYYYAFDILHYDGWDTSDLPQRERKKLLKGAVDWRDPLRYVIHRNESGQDFFRQACRSGWEGIIAKQADAAYVHSRSKHWLKFKCVSRQEFVIGGYTPPEGARICFGALLLGYYQNGKLRYAGKVGTGFNHETLRSLGKRLEKLRRARPAFEGSGLPGDVFWVEPRLVCEVGFSEWTQAGRLRHPRYLGLRHDKEPRQVHRESHD